MRTAARVDRNQGEIVDALRKAGYSVLVLSAVGKGCPDLLVGVDRNDGDERNLLLEVKMPGEKLTPRELRWHAEWKGQKQIVSSAEEALDYAFTFMIVERTD